MMNYVTIGFTREDGDFEVLATLNNGSETIPQPVFNALITHLTQIFRNEYEDGTIHPLYRQDAPDVVQLDEGA
jgi:hypothetical protein